jgi:large subunit ribosomal protein L37Ae
MALVKRDTAKQYGTRYGPSNRDKVRSAEKTYRMTQKCPHCGKVAVKRVCVGVFECSKCKTKFAARAYSIQSSQKVVEEQENGGVQVL